MDCPYLSSGKTKEVKAQFCGASFTRMAPGVEEVASWCSSEDHYRCPMLLSHVLRAANC